MNEKELPPVPESQNNPLAQNSPQPSEAAGTVVCPTCKRKLLTQTSPLCNWCGAQIDNPEYQAKAAQSRLERDQQERAESAAHRLRQKREGDDDRSEKNEQQTQAVDPNEIFRADRRDPDMPFHEL